MLSLKSYQPRTRILQPIYKRLGQSSGVVGEKVMAASIINQYIFVIINKNVNDTINYKKHCLLLHNLKV